MAIVLGNGTVTGLTNGGLNDGSLQWNDMYSGAVVNTNYTQTRTQASYNAPNSGLGTEIALLTRTYTAKKAGNHLILKYFIHSECSDHNIVYIITRNNVVLPDTTNATSGNGNRWAGIGADQYDGNVNSTPNPTYILFTDTNTLSTAATYRLHVRSSNGTARTYRFNRTYNSAGADSYEAGVSSVIIQEIKR